MLNIRRARRAPCPTFPSLAACRASPPCHPMRRQPCPRCTAPCLLLQPHPHRPRRSSPHCTNTIIRRRRNRPSPCRTLTPTLVPALRQHTTRLHPRPTTPIHPQHPAAPLRGSYLPSMPRSTAPRALSETFPTPHWASPTFGHAPTRACLTVRLVPWPMI